MVFDKVLPAIVDFLEGAQNLGLLKEFSLKYSDVNKETCNLHELNQLLSKFLQTVNEASNTKENVEVKQAETEPKVTANELPIDKSLVQIQVDENEMKRRIMAFMSRKRKEVDEWNVQEFCSRAFIDEQNPLWEESNSCARVDAVFIPRLGSKSHVKVSKVENRWGPQTQLHPEMKKVKLEPNIDDDNQQNNASIQNAIEERLQNMEYHLKMHTDATTRKSTFQRIKELEDRIVFLEGTSPEYFHLSETDYPSSRKRNHSEMEKMYSSWSHDDVQKRILNLKEYLKVKSQQVKRE